MFALSGSCSQVHKGTNNYVFPFVSTASTFKNNSIISQSIVNFGYRYYTSAIYNAIPRFCVEGLSIILDFGYFVIAGMIW